MCCMFKTDIDQMDLTQVKELVKVTEQFLTYAEALLAKGDISQEEYNSMTLLKRDFLDDVKTRYLIQK